MEIREMTKEREIAALKNVADYWYKEAKKLREEIDRLQTFKDNARCHFNTCDNKAEHSDGHSVYCSECWDLIEEVA